MEVKIIIWIILGLLYLFMRKKKPQAPAPSRRSGESESEHNSPVPDRPQTFEELLREIQGMKKTEQEHEPGSFDLPPAQQEREKEITTYDYNAPVEKRQIENTNYDYREHDKIYEVYEEAKQQAFYRPSLEESLKLSDTIIRFGQSKGYKTETRHNHAAEFLNELKDPKSFRKAFLLSEILKRKF